MTAADRPSAVAALQSALARTGLAGIETNLAWLQDVAQHPAFVAGRVSTRSLGEVEHRPQTVSVISGGPAADIQDYPGRS